MQRDAETTLARYEALQAESGLGAIEAISDDGSIKVRLDPEGRVADIDLHDAAMSHGPNLGRQVMAVIKSAKATHTEKTAELAQQLLGDKVDIQSILNQYRP
ncbi:YbaB/EbfC family nucleoid-associated protein [Glycomyces sp. NPDC046736]|uniref:YbaB/EbfC family nucleoid-associated protein n=1 Tax=Glycomyces sp. NPDC046736 TaxID=3155615 RepID=UPI00340B5338